MLAWCGIENCPQFTMHRDRQCRSGLLLFHMQHAVANVLAAHLDDIAAALRREEQQRESEPRLAADRMRGLKGGDFCFGPGMVTVSLWVRQLDVPRWICRDEFLRHAELHQVANGFQPITGRKWRQLFEYLFDKLRRHGRDRLIAGYLTQALENGAPRILRAGSQG